MPGGAWYNTGFTTILTPVPGGPSGYNQRTTARGMAFEMRREGRGKSWHQNVKSTSTRILIIAYRKPKARCLNLTPRGPPKKTSE